MIKCPNPPAARNRAFTLVELLVVISLILAMMALVVPAVMGIKGGTDLTKVGSEIAGTLDQARAFAMANNTYVWVGFAEVDAGKDASAGKQLPGIGRVAVAVVASKDGTRGYDNSSGGLTIPPFTSNGSSVKNGVTLTGISPLKHFENIHLGLLNTASTPGPFGAGGMLRPGITDPDYRIQCNQTTSSSVTNFDWPIGSVINSGQYQFSTVINFDPRGVARIQTANNKDTIGQYFEICLQQTHGTQISPGSNVCAIQIDCISGANRTYRP